MQQLLYWRIRISVRYTGPHLSTIHCSQGLSIYRPPIISSLRATHLRAHVAYKQQRDPRLASEQQPPYLYSSTDCALQQFGATCSVPRLISSAVARPHGGMGCTQDVVHCLPWIGRSHWSLAWYHRHLGRAKYLVTTAKVIVNQVWCYITLAAGGQTAKPAPATGPPAGRHRRGSAAGCRPSASRGSCPPTWRGAAR
jgi:hypothetical protein